MNAVVRQLVGYDQKTERLALKKNIPDDVLKHYKHLVALGILELVDAYRLDTPTARDLLGELRIPYKENLDYFIEGVQSPAPN